MKATLSASEEYRESAQLAKEEGNQRKLCSAGTGRTAKRSELCGVIAGHPVDSWRRNNLASGLCEKYRFHANIGRKPNGE